jgi:transposase
MPRSVIDDAMWERLKRLLPSPKGRHGHDDRLFLEAVCWIVRTGAPWRDLPAAYGKWQTVYGRYNRWIKRGHFNQILEILKKRWGSRMAHDRWEYCTGPSARSRS